LSTIWHLVKLLEIENGEILTDSNTVKVTAKGTVLAIEKKKDKVIVYLRNDFFKKLKI